MSFVSGNPNEIRQSAHESRDLVDIARLAYIYGLPSFRMALMRFRALKEPRARLNSFQHARVLRATRRNSDFLKSIAWLDLSREPLIIHLPEAVERYYSLAFVDFFTNTFAVRGRRSADSLGGKFSLVGPQWEGAEPGGMPLIRAPTNAVWIILRILVYGPTDFAAINAVQEQFVISRSRLRSELDTARSPHPLSLPVRQLQASSPLTFFDALNVILTENPPPASDTAILSRLQTIGVGPSLQFKRADFTPLQLKALKEGIVAGQNALRVGIGTRSSGRDRRERWPSDALLTPARPAEKAPRTTTRNRRRGGWICSAAPEGDFGRDYLLRARASLRSIGVLPRKEAMYFVSATDSLDDPLSGSDRYVLKFPAGKLPPVDAFWCLTAHQVHEQSRVSQTANTNNAQSIGNHSPALHYGRHGSLEILIQRDRPNIDKVNWLPAPEGRFQLTLRAYLPRSELLDGYYAIPKVRVLAD
jgi:hypothetical protein